MSDRLNDNSTYQRCFACGQQNPFGLKLRFRHEGDLIVSECTPGPEYAGFPGVVHGGIIATLLDESLSRLGAAQGRWLMTARLELRYRQAAPLGELLRVESRLTDSRSRLVRGEAVVRLADEPGTVYAEASGTFMPLPEDYLRHMIEAHPELSSFFNL